MTLLVDDVRDEIVVGTRLAEVLRVSLGDGVVHSSHRQKGAGPSIALSLLGFAERVVSGHPDAFCIRDAATLRPIMWTPRQQTLPRSACGIAAHPTSDGEHLVFLDYKKNLNLFSPRFAAMELVPCANLSAEDIGWAESEMESHREWMSFLVEFAGLVADGELIPKWDMELDLPE